MRGIALATFMVLACTAAMPLARAQSSASDLEPTVVFEGIDASQHARIRTAITESASRYTEWIGHGRHQTFTVVPAADAPDPAAGRIGVAVPLRSAARSMRLEAEAAYGVARSWWPSAADDRGEALLNGISRYLQGRAVAALYERQYRRAGSGAWTIELLDGAIEWPVTSVIFDSRPAMFGREQLLARNDDVAREAARIGTVEGYVGAPRWIAALRALHTVPEPMTRAQMIARLSDALGQDVAWLLESSDDLHSINYRIVNVRAADAPDGCAPPCTATDVVLSHDGSLRTPAPSGDDYSAPKLLPLRIEFAGGSQLNDSWDGRPVTRSYEASGAVTRVSLDPERSFLVDANLLDNSWAADARTNVPVSKWMARFAIWLQHAMLSYTFIG